MRIYKYPVVPLSVDPTGSFPIQVVQYADILCAGLQEGTICIWAKVNPLVVALETRTIEIYATGETMDQSVRRYLHSIQDGYFTWHVFVR